MLSLKVRSLYDSGVGVGGSDTGSQFSKRTSSALDDGKRMSRVSRSSFVVGQNSSGDEGIAEEDGVEEGLEEQGISQVPEEEGSAVAEEEKTRFARAGGTEDWEDIDGRDVDRLVIPFLYPSGQKISPEMKLFLVFHDTSGRENFSTPHHSSMASRDLE